MLSYRGASVPRLSHRSSSALGPFPLKIGAKDAFLFAHARPGGAEHRHAQALLYTEILSLGQRFVTTTGLNAICDLYDFGGTNGPVIL